MIISKRFHELVAVNFSRIKQMLLRPRWQVLAGLVVVMLFAVGCKTREVGSAPAATGAVVFQDDFEREQLGTDWQRGTGESGAGKWIIEDGWLRGQDLKNDPLWLAQDLPTHTRVEFDAKALSPEGDIKVELFGDGENHASGYVLIFGGWGNTLDVIARLDEHGDDRKARTSRKVEPDRVYRMALERSQNTIKWFVDGELFMTYEDSTPLTGRDHARFAFGNWSAPVAFDNVKIFRVRS